MSESTIIVRHAEKGDLAFVSQDGYLAESIMTRKIQDGDVFIATCDGREVGYLRLEYLWSRHPYVELIRVAVPDRRSGVGRALLSYAEAEAEAHGHVALYSSSQTDEPEPQAWHRHMGFEECGLLAGVNDGGVGEIFFRKMLSRNGMAM